MPCFKGLAVSIHTPDGPLPEYSVQRQSRASRIACYIPVPPPKLPASPDGKPEQSTFAISVTLLTPGMKVPYSAPKPSTDHPNPTPKIVAGSHNQPSISGSVSPYQPLTASPSETIAAYIYFDGRQKEEVATLLRRGEETWVNSRWVSLPESEGGGLAEREFLFREVGLERWLNGLDLEGTDAAERVERRRQKMEKRKKKRELRHAARHQGNNGNDLSTGMDLDDKKPKKSHNVLRYGADAKSPLGSLSDDAEIYSSEDESDNDPIPETTGQIKVALFRVLASGEIKRGEYAPQFDANEEAEDEGSKGGNADEVDHTTSFAKPRSLDPKSISTQTVTGIDPAERPYAIFTFMYRGERQLQKMGILKSSKPQEKDVEKGAKGHTGQTDFSQLGQLKSGGGAGFLKFRDHDSHKPSRGKQKAKKGSMSDMESDDEEEDGRPILDKADKAEDEEIKDANAHLSLEEAKLQGELAEGVRQIKLKRQHSSDPVSDIGSNADATRPSKSTTPTSRLTPPAPSKLEIGSDNSSTAKETIFGSLDESFVGSPLKKQRASVSDSDNLRQRLGSNISANIHEAMGLDVGSTEANSSVANSKEVRMSADGKTDEEQL